MHIGPHIPDDVLEKYLLHRLSEPELAPVEEHLLVCEKCRARTEEIEEFVTVTQAALRESDRKPVRRAARAGSFGFLHSWLSASVLAAIAAAVTAAVYLPIHRPASTATAAYVSLEAMRGSDALPVHVRAGGSLVVDLNTTGLPADGNYRVHVLDSRATEVWSGAPEPAGDWLRATIGVGLKPGRYWVRLAHNGELVREYGLLIDR